MCAATSSDLGLTGASAGSLASANVRHSADADVLSRSVLGGCPRSRPRSSPASGECALVGGGDAVTTEVDPAGVRDMGEMWRVGQVNEAMMTASQAPLNSHGP